jgi:mRNA interferase MazF
VKQFEIWWADLPKPAGRRPVLLLSRDSAYEYLNKFVVAEVTTKIRDIPVEVPLGRREGMAKPCVANCDNLRTVRREALDGRISPARNQPGAGGETRRRLRAWLARADRRRGVKLRRTFSRGSWLSRTAQKERTEPGQPPDTEHSVSKWKKGAALRWVENKRLGRHLRGRGVEIGALWRRFPVAARCVVWYVDRHPLSDLRREYPELGRATYFSGRLSRRRPASFRRRQPEFRGCQSRPRTHAVSTRVAARLVSRARCWRCSHFEGPGQALHL